MTIKSHANEISEFIKNRGYTYYNKSLTRNK